ncbi:MAG: hypothetical protein IJB79_07505 [Candidatus Gastranaerophilales bacterium]|nr:hypothetical protein [Candidatus Gastranaerophilales bacterium]
MSKTSCAPSKKAAISHGLELLEYSTTRNLRKKIMLYEFENSFVSKYKAYKDFKLLEKELSSDKKTTKNKKIAKLQ